MGGAEYAFRQLSQVDQIPYIYPSLLGRQGHVPDPGF